MDSQFLFSENCGYNTLLSLIAVTLEKESNKFKRIVGVLNYKIVVSYVKLPVDVVVIFLHVGLTTSTLYLKIFVDDYCNKPPPHFSTLAKLTLFR